MLQFWFNINLSFASSDTHKLNFSHEKHQNQNIKKQYNHIIRHNQLEKFLCIDIIFWLIYSNLIYLSPVPNLYSHDDDYYYLKYRINLNLISIILFYFFQHNIVWYWSCLPLTSMYISLENNKLIKFKSHINNHQQKKCDRSIVCTF